MNPISLLAALPYPRLDPFIFRIGPVGLSWYAFMYLLGFTAAYFILRHRFKEGSFRLKRQEHVGTLIFYCAYGLILGARVFYIVFYNPRFYWEHPLEVFAVWNGGMSFHGGLVGVLIAAVLFARQAKVPLLHILDALALSAPAGLAFGRLGNFINGELYGRVTDIPWAMVFPSGGPLPRHPSQLYESFLEGIVLGAILLWIASKKPRDGVLSAALLIGYGVFRFTVEFFRQPDAQLGAILGPFSMGQLLSAVLVAAGVILMARRRTAA